MGISRQAEIFAPVMMSNENGTVGTHGLEAHAARIS
jgi:hypothetical protein